MSVEASVNHELLNSTRQKLAILDAGAQYGKVIDRRIRALAVESDLLPMNTPAENLKDYGAIIISGGHQSVYDDDAPTFDPQVFKLDKPILGICYGMQLMNQESGGIVGKKEQREDGPCVININLTSTLFANLGQTQQVLMSHGDSIIALAPGFRVTANSNGIVAAIENQKKRFYGVQFHPEVDLTTNGNEILHRFLYEVADFTGEYTMEDREAKAIAYIHEKVKDKEILALVSGGVDSTVCVALCAKAVGADKIHAVHIDNGQMRHEESKQVKLALEQIGINPQVVDATDEFFNATTIINGLETPPLHQVTDPEIKRVIIGNTFIKISNAVIESLGLDWDNIVLAQGSLRPDLIESASQIASQNADKIKTHHNDTEEVRRLRQLGRVIEPLQDYHKDEVRELGKNLGLPETIVWRQPFPGPGLAVRLLCTEAPYEQADFAHLSEMLYFTVHYNEAPPYIRNLFKRIYIGDSSVKSSSLSSQVQEEHQLALKNFHEFEKQLLAINNLECALLPIRTVGVQGDGRSYSYLAGLNGQRNWEEMFFLAKLLPKIYHKINRVAYIFGEPIDGPPTEITPTWPTPEAIKQLRAADYIVTQVLSKHNLLRRLSQVPVVSFPVNFGIPGNRSIAIRPFITNDFMTGVAAIPGVDLPEEAVDEMVMRILNEVPNISRVAYDLTSKPPGTTEWE